MKVSKTTILWIIFFWPYGIYRLYKDLNFNDDEDSILVEDTTLIKRRSKEEIENEKLEKEKRRKKREETRKKLAEEKQKKILTLSNKFGKEEVNKALRGKIWTNMSFQLYREAQLLRPSGRKFGKKFENVVNGEERHKYRFDSYKNRQGKTSYNFEVDTKAGFITGWKNLEGN